MNIQAFPVFYKNSLDESGNKLKVLILKDRRLLEFWQNLKFPLYVQQVL